MPDDKVVYFITLHILSKIHTQFNFCIIYKSYKYVLEFLEDSGNVTFKDCTNTTSTTSILLKHYFKR